MLQVYASCPQPVFLKSIKIMLYNLNDCKASQSLRLPHVCSFQIGGSHLRTEFSNPAGSSMQADRGSSAWMPPRHESTMGTQIPGPPPLVPGFGPSNPPPRPPMVIYLLMFSLPW